MSSSADSKLEDVAAEVRRFDPDGSKIARVLRETFDQLYDGKRTGRYRWDQLYQTEKKYCDPIIKMNFHREFNFTDGATLDYRIAGAEVDCKYSQTLNAWMIPPEARGHLCLLVWTEDNADPTWRVGIVRILEEGLNTGGNRDKKATLNQTGRNAIVWIFKDVALPPNVLLQLNASIVKKIFEPTSGMQRINELFRNTLGMRVGRAVVETVAQQLDPMKRVRGNGGARTYLRPEGILILGQYQSHCAVARSLGVPAPRNSEFVPVRVVPASRRGTGVAEIQGGLWRVAKPNDPIVTAPLLPTI